MKKIVVVGSLEWLDRLKEAQASGCSPAFTEKAAQLAQALVEAASVIRRKGKSNWRALEYAARLLDGGGKAGANFKELVVDPVQAALDGNKSFKGRSSLITVLGEFSALLDRGVYRPAGPLADVEIRTMEEDGFEAAYDPDQHNVVIAIDLADDDAPERLIRLLRFVDYPLVIKVNLENALDRASSMIEALLNSAIDDGVEVIEESDMEGVADFIMGLADPDEDKS